MMCKKKQAEIDAFLKQANPGLIMGALRGASKILPAVLKGISKAKPLKSLVGLGEKTKKVKIPTMPKMPSASKAMNGLGNAAMIKSQFSYGNGGGQSGNYGVKHNVGGAFDRGSF